MNLEATYIPPLNNHLQPPPQPIRKKARFVKFREDEETLDLNYFRTELTMFSLKKSGIRINLQKIKRLTVDPIEEENIIDEELKPITNYSIESTEFGDSSCISRGILSPDDSKFAISGWSGDCKIYDLTQNSAEPQKITELIGHSYQVYDINFHPSFGKNILSKDSPN